jgi:hypothetical protein
MIWNMSSVIAIAVDGVWAAPAGDDAHRAITSTNPVDHAVALLAEVIALAQNLSEQDQRRIRDFVHAASSVLSATTVLPEQDQRIFETALRNIVRR